MREIWQTFETRQSTAPSLLRPNSLDRQRVLQLEKKRGFLFRQSIGRLLRKHMFTLRVQKGHDLWFSIRLVCFCALRFVVIVLVRDIIDYFASKIFLIFLDLVTCKNKEMSASFPRQKFHWPSRFPPPFFLSVMSCGPSWASALHCDLY